MAQPHNHNIHVCPPLQSSGGEEEGKIEFPLSLVPLSLSCLLPQLQRPWFFKQMDRIDKTSCFGLTGND